MRLAGIEAHIGSMGELLDIVGAMRSLASMRVQEAQRALPGIRRYSETMAEAIGAALLLAPHPVTWASPGKGRRILVLCTSEHGFVGGFNGRVLDAAEAEPDDFFMVLGSRGAALAQERCRPLDWTQPMASRPEGVPAAVRRVTGEIYRLVVGGGIDRAEVVFARHRTGAPMAIERRTLFPIDRTLFAPQPSRLPPLHNLPAEVLLEKLIADHVSALLTEALIESLASENAARFAAMEAAHDNVSKKLEQLRQDARLARQGEITEELLDLVTGSGALADPRSTERRPK